MDSSVDPSIVVAGISFVGVLITLSWTNRQANQLANLTHQLDERQAARTKAEQAEALVARYRDPLLESAYDLQSRLYNALSKTNTFRWGADDNYFLPSTLFLIGQFFGWIEIVRLDMRYSDIADVGQVKVLLQKTRAIQHLFSSTAGPYHDKRRIYRVDQRAIGEVMIDDATLAGDGITARTTIGYATFTQRMKDSEFARWFSGIAHGLDSPPAREQPDRLRAIQIELIDLINFLDPGGERFPGDRVELAGNKQSDQR